MPKTLSPPLVRALGAVVLACLAATAASAQNYAKDAKDRKTSVPERVSGPFTHDNLSIFFLHGDDPIKDRKFLTLDEAIARKKVVVHETKDVNKVAIENVSSEDVFVQAGDVLKGGQQDRTVAVDLVVPAKSGKVSLASFCVEQGRWSQRDMEDVLLFHSSKDSLIGNRLKLAVRSQRSPGQVWRGVSYEQSRLTKTLNADVKDPKSETSLQLTLENKKVVAAVEAHEKRLQTSLDKQKDVIGYAVAINGKVSYADVYANADLFRKLWPKLLKCAAIEALAEKTDKIRFMPAKASDVVAFLAAEPLQGKDSRKDVTKEWRELQQETKSTYFFETGNDKGVLRRSYLAK